jgi:outer membrane biogenesis lipoprotein LolB
MKKLLTVIAVLLLSACANTSTSYSRTPEQINQQYFSKQHREQAIIEQQQFWARQGAVSPEFAHLMQIRSFFYSGLR